MSDNPLDGFEDLFPELDNDDANEQDAIGPDHPQKNSPRNNGHEPAREAKGSDRPVHREFQFTSKTESHTNPLTSLSKKSLPEIAAIVATQCGRVASSASWFQQAGPGDSEEETVLSDEYITFSVAPDFSQSSAAIREDFELLQRIAQAASQAATEKESISLSTAMVPVCLCLAPLEYQALWIALPSLALGVGGVASLLYRQESQREAMCMLPGILYIVVQRLSSLLARGALLNNSIVTSVLSREIQRVFSEWQQFRKTDWE